MNEQLQEALAELLGKANNGIDTAGDFLASELPEVIQQLLMWHGVKSLVECVFGVSMFLLIFLYAKAIPKYIKEIDDDAIEALSIISSIVGCFVALIVGLVHLNIQWLQIWIAPKVWLIEYAAKLAS